MTWQPPSGEPDTTNSENLVSDTTPIATSGYTAWFLTADGSPFGLPVVALVLRFVNYSGEPDGRSRPSGGPPS
jgi:hypothetical protein